MWQCSGTCNVVHTLVASITPAVTFSRTAPVRSAEQGLKAFLAHCACSAHSTRAVLEAGVCAKECLHAPQREGLCMQRAAAAAMEVPGGHRARLAQLPQRPALEL